MEKHCSENGLPECEDIVFDVTVIKIKKVSNCLATIHQCYRQVRQTDNGPMKMTESGTPFFIKSHKLHKRKKETL